MVSTVSPKAKLTPRNPMPSDGKPAASTALPQPANVSQKVPKNSAPRRRHMTMFLPRGSCLPSHFFMSELGQNRKSSTRAHVFRFAPESGHCATESACPFRALPDIGWRSLLMATHGLPPPKRKPSMLAEKPNNRSDPRRVVGRKSKVLIVLKRGGAA